MKKNWGLGIVPESQWVDLNATYRTRSGKRVIHLDRTLYNSNGVEVTFPVKGSVVVREKPFKSKYQIWTLDGRADVVNKSNDDLVKADDTL